MAYSVVDGVVHWKGKPARIAKGRTLRMLDAEFATDGVDVLHNQTRIRMPRRGAAGLELARVRAEVCQDQPTRTLFAAAFTDGQRVLIHHMDLDGEAVAELPGADFDTLRTLPLDNGVPTAWFADAHRVWWFAAPLAGCDVTSARPLAHDVLRDAHGTWIRGVRWQDAPATLIVIDTDRRGTLLLSERGLHAAGPSGEPALPQGPVLVAPRVSVTSPAALFDTAFQSLADEVLGILDNDLPGRLQVNDLIETSRAPAWRAAPRFGVGARLEDAQLVLAVPDGTEVRVPAATWWTGLCTLHARQRGWPDRLFTYQDTGTMQPAIDDMPAVVVRHHPGALIDVAGAVARAGAEGEAQLMLTLLKRWSPHLWWRGLPADVETALVRQPLAAFGRWSDEAGSPTDGASTHGSALTRTLASGQLDHADPLERLEALLILGRIALGTGNRGHNLHRVAAATLPRLDTEASPYLREHALVVLDAVALSHEMGEIAAPAQLEPIACRLVHERVNVATNRLRLAEALTLMDRDGEAAAEIEAVRAVYGDDVAEWGVKGGRWPTETLDLAALSMRVRAMARTTDKDRRARLKALIEADRARLLARHSMAALEAMAGWNISARKLRDA